MDYTQSSIPSTKVKVEAEEVGQGNQSPFMGPLFAPPETSMMGQCQPPLDIPLRLCVITSFINGVAEHEYFTPTTFLRFDPGPMEIQLVTGIGLPRTIYTRGYNSIHSRSGSPVANPAMVLIQIDDLLYNLTFEKVSDREMALAAMIGF